MARGEKDVADGATSGASGAGSGVRQPRAGGEVFGASKYSGKAGCPVRDVGGSSAHGFSASHWPRGASPLEKG